MALKAIVVGLGKQNVQDYLPALQANDKFEIVAVCDLEPAKVEEVSQRYDCKGVVELDRFLVGNGREIDVAFVAVPHNQYKSVIWTLAKHGIDIIKEKPFAMCKAEAAQIAQEVYRNNVTLMMTLQRRHDPFFQTFGEYIGSIGDIHNVSAQYVMNIPQLDEGWRSQKSLAGGGALIDLGYHYVDLLIWYFGIPSRVFCNMSSGNRPKQRYDVEDTAAIQFAYKRNGRDSVIGQLLLSRVHWNKREHLRVIGTKGGAVLDNEKITVDYDNGESLEISREDFPSQSEVLQRQLNYFGSKLLSGEFAGKIDPHFLEQMAFVEAAYQSATDSCPIGPSSVLSVATVNYGSVV
ncbi:Gfo/Idh/MocA family protein [Pseudovibrio ascidiaceicola]|uniref:Gfo/Idh/MocA family protein n=1 Tax=Pseudovibrio ascidiaceicola TaxID=285279 RepID=UPI003D35BE9F